MDTFRATTPFQAACESNSLEIIKMFYEFVNPPTEEYFAKKYKTIHLVTMFGDTMALKLYLEHNPNVDEVTSDGYTALHISAEAGKEELVSQLIDAGADVNLETNEGYTALHFAAMGAMEQHHHFDDGEDDETVAGEGEDFDYQDNVSEPEMSIVFN
jgi:hypothetical protein